MEHSILKVVLYMFSTAKFQNSTIKNAIYSNPVPLIKILDKKDTKEES